MKHTVKCATKCAAAWLLTLFIITNLYVLLGANKHKTQFIEKIEFSPGTESPVVPRAFCVTEDELFLIPDCQTGHIKIYEKNGKHLELIKTIGRKGFGQNEFVKPILCFCNKWFSPDYHTGRLRLQKVKNPFFKKRRHYEQI